MVPWVAYIGYSSGADFVGTLLLGLLFLLVFLCVVLHEFGHALAARRYGIQTEDIILSPIGGVARMRRMPDKPLREFIVALAGPMVNVVIAFILGIYFIASNMEFFTLMGESGGILDEVTAKSYVDNMPWLDQGIGVLIMVNIMLVLFNLIPAFPMDGGRMFRAILSGFTDRVTATKIAAYVGQAFAVIFLVIGLSQQQYMFALVGFFVGYMAMNELRMIRTDALYSGLKVGQVTRYNYTRLDVFSTQSQVIEMFMHGWEKNFLVFDGDGTLIGILTEASIIKWMNDTASFSTIHPYINREFPTLHSEQSFREAFKVMQQHQLDFLPVTLGGSVIGVVDKNAMFEFMRIQEKIKK